MLKYVFYSETQYRRLWSRMHVFINDIQCAIFSHVNYYYLEAASNVFSLKKLLFVLLFKVLTSTFYQHN